MWWVRPAGATRPSSWSAATEPDLAILDIKMPGSDGLAAARAIATSEQRVAVLILTAFSQRDLIEEAREAGVAAYLVKPFQRDRAGSCHRPGRVPAASRSGPSTPRPTRCGPATVGCPTAAEDKLETRRLVDGAKDLLMERYGLSESDAFNFIQKTAMGSRSRMSDVARQVLDGTITP